MIDVGRLLPHRRTTSPYCAFGLGDTALRDVAFGGLGPALVAFAGDQSPQWERTATLLETVASPNLRCLLADPRHCPTAAPLLGYAAGAELVLVFQGLPMRVIDPQTPAPEIVRIVSQTVTTSR